MSRLSEQHGAICVNVLLTCLLMARAEVEDGEDLGQALCSKLDDCWSKSDTETHPLDAVNRLRRQLYREWPKFSGNETFPVPGRGTVEDEEIVAEVYLDRYTEDGEELDFDNQCKLADIYFNAVDDGDLHDGEYWTGRYGELRRELMQFMIDELQKEAIA